MNIGQYLRENGTLTYANKGSSMWPLLREGRDMFTLRRKDEERCRRGDVVLYRRPPNFYVLHRVIDVRENDYVILGDNCTAREYGITDADILGVMTGFNRGGREYSVDDFGYRLYTFMILHTITIRTFTKRVISWIIRRL
ncbi:MAG: S24/S26 family peptidase [Synergistaceae bacterium]|nr:S24/S26 family peptidase [Synergistaceae bacterium]MBQ6970839.1 S24/S26 family peptidase [Synergistaceae bacterium]